MKYVPVYSCAVGHVCKGRPTEVESLDLYIPVALSQPCPLCIADYRAGRTKKVSIAYLREVEEAEND